MACEPSEVTTEYVPLQYVPLQYVSWRNMARGLSAVVTKYGLRAFWDYNRICPAAICPAVICLLAHSLSKIVTEYGLRAVWGYNRICPAAICLMAHLRLQLNMARDLSGVVTKYGLRAVWGYNRISPAAKWLLAKYDSCLVWGCDRICLAGHLRLQPNTSRCNMHVSWLNMAPGAWSPELNLITFLHCSLLYLTYTKVVKSWGDLKNAPKWYARSLELDLITFWHCSFLYLTHIFRNGSFLYLTHTQI